MRTTLDIDPDILKAAKEMASSTKRTAGQVLSDLARRALVADRPPLGSEPELVNGFEVIPSDQRIVTPEFVRKLMEESELP